MSRRTGGLLLLPVVGLLVVWGLSAGAGSGEEGWATIERDDLILGVEVNGTLQAVETKMINPPRVRDFWQFKIADMVPEGDAVNEGDVVLKFDTSELQQRLQREIAERDAAEKRVEREEKEQEVDRQRNALAFAEAEGKLRKAELKVDVPVELEAASELQLIRLDLELARREVAFLQAQLQSAEKSAAARLGALRSQLQEAQSQVESTQHDIEKMNCRAPRDGTVTYVANWRGDKKKVGDSCWMGESVIELPDLSRMKAQGTVHEAEAGRVAVGQRVRLRLDAHPDIDFMGTVESIWRTVERESWSSELKVVRLEVSLDETDTRRMRPGMRFRGEIETERIEQALVMDVRSVLLEPEGPTVQRRTWSGYEPVRVELGRRSKDRIEVLEGLAVGDRVSQFDRRRKRGGA